MRSILILTSGLALAPIGCSSTSSGTPDGGASSSVSATYNCMDSVVLMFTMPTSLGTQMGSTTATYTVVDNHDGTITISLAAPDGGVPCTTHFSLSGTTATLLPNQTCETHSPTADLHFSYTSGAVNLSSGANTYAFAFTGTLTGDGGTVPVAGTGTDSQMCTKQ
jgi:hypothetical protein